MRAACRSLALVTIVLPAWAVAAAPASTAKTGPIPSFTLKGLSRPDLRFGQTAL